MLIQFIIIILVVLFIILAFYRYKRRELSAGKFLFWAIFWLAVGLLSLIIRKTDVFAQFLGVYRAIDLAVYGAIVLLFYMIFRILIKIERLERQITKIVQKISLRERSLDDIQKRPH